MTYIYNPDEYSKPKNKKELAMKESQYEALQRTFIEYNNLKVGDKVKVLRTARQNELGWKMVWTTAMDKVVGTISEVVKIFPDDDGIQLSNTHCKFPFFVLEKVEEPEDEVIKFGYGHAARIVKSGVYLTSKYGGHCISFETFDKIAEAVAKIRPPKKVYFADVQIGQKFRVVKSSRYPNVMTTIFTKIGGNSVQVDFSPMSVSWGWPSDTELELVP